MGRLTIHEIEKTASELMYYKDKLANGIFGDKIGCFDKAMEALKELQKYKDLEEQGRLIEQKHGTWLPNRQMIRTPMAENYHCSECTQTGKTSAYCPNCGAKMDLKELEE